MELLTPFTDEKIRTLFPGDKIELTGVVYTARDAAHERMYRAYREHTPPPFEYKGNAVFYAGPCPPPPGKVIGSIGPTTAGRMDAYSPVLIRAGLKVMIGKGSRNTAVIDAIKKHKGLYLVGVGGVAALMAKCIVKSEIVAYDDLGTEAIRRLEIVKLPLIVGIDHLGRSVYD